MEWVKKEKGTEGDSEILSWDVRMVMSLANTGQAAGGRDKALRFICAGQQVLMWGTASAHVGDSKCGPQGCGVERRGRARGTSDISTEALGMGWGTDLRGNRVGGGLA